MDLGLGGVVRKSRMVVAPPGWVVRRGFEGRGGLALVLVRS